MAKLTLKDNSPTQYKLNLLNFLCYSHKNIGMKTNLVLIQTKIS